MKMVLTTKILGCQKKKILPQEKFQDKLKNNRNSFSIDTVSEKEKNQSRR